MIPIAKPFFGEEERRAVQLPLESGWVVQGPFVKQFEEKFSGFVGSRFSIAASSCTTALHLAVASLGVKPGDEVIVPAFTWVSTPNAVEYAGARPVFCDINLATFNIDEAQIGGLISPRTVGIIPVHLFGLCAEMKNIVDLASKHGLWVVEDAACAVGARYHDRHAGTFGAMGCFSFHPRKSITTGEGGMIVTGREDLAKRLRSLRDHGASRSDLERHEKAGSHNLAEYNELGYNYRMTDLQGALGSAQMDRLTWILAQRARLAARYDSELKGLGWLRMPSPPEGFVHAYQAYVCLFRPDEPTMGNVKRMSDQRNDLMAKLESKGIATRPGSHAPVIQGYYASKHGLRPDQFPNAYMADRLSLALPLYAQLSESEQDLVIEEVQAAYAGS